MQVCVGKEREERVRLELKATELEEELETQASHISSVKWVELHTHIVTTHTVYMYLYIHTTF